MDNPGTEKTAGKSSWGGVLIGERRWKGALLGNPQGSWISAHQRPGPPQATGWDKAAVLGRLLRLPRPSGPGDKRPFFSRTERRSRLFARQGKGAASQLQEGGWHVEGGACVRGGCVTGAAFPGDPSQLVECVV